MMLEPELKFINEESYLDRVSPLRIDSLLEDGWRHFGKHFFRYNFAFYHTDIRYVIPLRIRLASFSLSKSQRRVLKKNSDLQTKIRPIEITGEAAQLFDRHKVRFDHAVPNSIHDFISTEPASVPCEAKEITVYDGERLLAVSYFDIGGRSTSGIYAMFDPNERSRGLGIFTMLKEIQFAIDERKEFYYQGYCYQGESFYDYKKRFRGTEAFDWNGNWTTFGGK
jgi:arginyl-tRNA--protein-N-Asp/Glu arginylyltransferase